MQGRFPTRLCYIALQVNFSTKNHEPSEPYVVFVIIIFFKGCNNRGISINNAYIKKEGN